MLKSVASCWSRTLNSTPGRKFVGLHVDLHAVVRAGIGQSSQLELATDSIPPLSQLNSLYVVLVIQVSGRDDCWTQSLAHLALDAELLSKDDHNDGRGGHDEPEEEGKGQRTRVVRGENEVDEDECDTKVKNHPWFANEGEEEVDTTSDK
jgi:hypothetical protein